MAVNLFLDLDYNKLYGYNLEENIFSNIKDFRTRYFALKTKVVINKGWREKTLKGKN